MPPDRIDARHFSPDTREFLRLLHLHEVRYLIVGGEATIYYGHARLTGDVDFFYDPAPDNAKRLFEALDEFWDGAIPGLEGANDLMKPGMVIQFGRPPNRIDLINRIEEVGFQDAWQTRREAILSVRERDVPVYYLGLASLVRNKQAVGRPKDLADLVFLRGALKKQSK